MPFGDHRLYLIGVDVFYDMRGVDYIVACVGDHGEVAGIGDDIRFGGGVYI